MGLLSVFFAAFLEIAGVTSLNRYSRDKKLLDLAGIFVFFGLSFFFLNIAFQYLPLSVAYVIWTGIGTAGGVIISMIFFGESKDWRRIGCIAVIIIAVIGLQIY